MSTYPELLRKFEEISKLLNLPDAISQRIYYPDRSIEMSIPVGMDDGSSRTFIGYRVQHSAARGPYKGGIRYHPDVTLEEVKDLAMRMSLKCALLKLPLGGAKGAVVCDPKQLSHNELKKLTRRFANSLMLFIGPERDIPAPDVGTDETVMAWIMDTISQAKGYAVPAVVTGKPIDIGGTLGRKEATGRGCMVVTLESMKKYGMDPSSATVSVQGFGNVGSIAAQLLAELGVRVVAVSDSKGAIYRAQGLLIPDVISFRDQTGSIVGFPQADSLSDQEFLSLKTDVFIPAALGGLITKDNARFIKAKLIVEGANGPLTDEADRILLDRGAIIVPDILANGGGVMVSSYEMSQDLQSFFWDEEEVNTRLQSRMRPVILEVFAEAEERKIDLRTAAYLLGVKRIAKAIEARGIFP